MVPIAHVHCRVGRIVEAHGATRGLELHLSRVSTRAESGDDAVEGDGIVRKGPRVSSVGEAHGRRPVDDEAKGGVDTVGQVLHAR